MNHMISNRYMEFGRNFLNDAAVLGRALGHSSRQIADALLKGRSADYAQTILRELEFVQDEELRGQLEAFRAAAETYSLPAHLLASPQRLLWAVTHAGVRPGAAGELAEIPDSVAEMNFLSRLAVLGALLGYPPRILAQLVFGGSVADLVDLLSDDARNRATATPVRMAEILKARAEDFVLPERYRKDPEALMRFMARAASCVLK